MHKTSNVKEVADFPILLSLKHYTLSHTVFLPRSHYTDKLLASYIWWSMWLPGRVLLTDSCGQVYNCWRHVIEPTIHLGHLNNRSRMEKGFARHFRKNHVSHNHTPYWWSTANDARLHSSWYESTVKSLTEFICFHLFITQGLQPSKTQCEHS